MDELIGTNLGNYVIKEALGQGGMAKVYKAYQANLDRTVAIKVLPAHFAADESFVERFKLEARALARLAHPNIVTVHDAGENEGRLFIVMELLEGGTLRQKMGSPMTVSEVLDITRQIGGALTYAHDRNIIHRDIKPVNVLLSMDERAVLSDFGIAKIMASDNTHQLTQAGTGIGTPDYMSPEQCKGIQIDTRSDIYSLGIMVFEMLAGQTPFTGDNYAALAHAHIYESVPSLRSFNDSIPASIDVVIRKCLSKDPDQRYSKAADFAHALEDASKDTSYVHVESSGRKFCPACNTANALNTKFCTKCGTKLSPDSGKQPAESSPQTPGSNIAAVVTPTPSVLICRSCKREVPITNKFCTGCGTQMSTETSMIRCKCGKEQPFGRKFCTSCGNTLTPAQPGLQK